MAVAKVMYDFSGFPSNTNIPSLHNVTLHPISGHSDHVIEILNVLGALKETRGDRGPGTF